MELVIAIMFSIIYIFLLIELIINKVTVSKIKKTGAIVIKNYDFYVIPLMLIMNLIILYSCWYFAIDLGEMTNMPVYFYAVLLLSLAFSYVILKAAKYRLVFFKGKFKVFYIFKRPYSFVLNDIDSVLKKRSIGSVNYDTVIYLKNNKKIVIERDAMIIEDLFYQNLSNKE